MKAQVGDSNCVVCGFEITNPICTGCLEKEVKNWLRDGRIWNKVKSPDPFIGTTSLNCIKCHNHVGLCAYCYLKEIKELVLKEKPEMEESFTESFNLDLMELDF